MTKDDLIAHLEYCSGDTEILVRIQGKFLPVVDVQHLIKLNLAPQLALIPSIPRKGK